MEMSGDEQIRAAADEVVLLAEAIHDGGGSLQPVYGKLDAFIAEMNAEGIQPADFLPADAEPGLGFSLSDKRGGKSLWEYIAASCQAKLCDPKSDEHKAVLGALKTAGVPSLVTTILATLGLPLLAIPVVITVSAVVLSLGLSGFCQYLDAVPDEPPKA